MVIETFSLARRDLRKWWKSKFSVLFTLIRSLAWLLIFGKAFNPVKLVGQSQVSSNLSASLGGAPDYFSYMAAGMLSVMMLQLSMRGMGGMVFDRYLGFLDKELVSPIRREFVLLSKVVSSLVRGIIQAMVLFVTAIALGMRLSPSFGFLELLAVFSALALLGLGLSSIFVSVGAMVTRWETQEAISSVLTFPIMFTSTVLYPISTMPTWLQPFATLNPVTHSTEIIRELFYGKISNLNSVVFSVEMLVGFTIISAFILIISSANMCSSH